MSPEKPDKKPTKIPGTFFSFPLVPLSPFQKNILVIVLIILPVSLSVLLTACGVQNTPTMPPTDVEGTAVSSTWTMVAVTENAIPTITPLPPTEIPSPTPLPTYAIPNPTLSLQEVFADVDKQFENLQKANLAFNKPEKIKKDETASIELILSPSKSQPALATQLVEQGGFVTSTADPGMLIGPNGEMVAVETSQIEITPRMKAILKPQDSGAFVIVEMHDNPEQVVSSVDTTTWRWSVTAKKEGTQTLELVIYQLVKYDGEEFWPEVESYKADIVVEVTVADRVKSWNWYSIIGAVVAVVGSVLSVWKWRDERKKKAAENKPPAPTRRIK